MIDYKIYIDNGSGLVMIYQVGDPDLSLADIHYKPSVGCAGTLEFNIRPTHPYFSQIKALTTFFWLYKDGAPIFRGRFVGAEEDFLRTGALTIEGDLNFLLDSVQDPFKFSGTLTNYVAQIVNNHNSMVEARKRLTVGSVAAILQGNVQIEFTDYTNSLECLRALTNDHGGYIRTRHVGDVTYLDLVLDYGGSNTQTVKFGENMIDLTKSIDAASIVTCLIPLGAKVDKETANGTESLAIDITSVNNGSKYITSAAGVSQYGQIWGAKTFDYCLTPDALLTEARAWLDAQVSLPTTISLTAVDLSIIDANFESFELGKWTTVESTPHGLIGSYLLQDMDVNISDPSQSSITLGGKVTTISESTAKNMAEVNRQIQDLSNETSTMMNEKINNATQLITGGLGGYVVIHQNPSDKHPDEILIMDSPSISQAKNLIRFNRNGIGFSNSGYNGTYRNAWTIDGNLVADFITTGQMSADRIKGGSLEIGGSGYARNGSIVIKNMYDREIGRWDRNGISIRSGTLDVGKFYASDDEVQIGPFKVYQSDTSGADYLATSTKKVGMGNHPDFAFWAGSSGNNPPFAVKQNGYTYVKELFPQGSWWGGWSLTRIVRAMWRALQDAGYDPNDYD